MWRRGTVVSNEKPAEVKRKIGSRAYKPGPVVVALPQVSGVPEPARELETAGADLWERAWTVGRAWLNGSTDVDLLLMTCEQLDERETLRELVLAEPGAWRERAALRELEKSISRGLSLMGFTPTDRMKLGVAEVRAKSKLEELAERRESRVNGE